MGRLKFHSRSNRVPGRGGSAGFRLKSPAGMTVMEISREVKYYHVWRSWSESAFEQQPPLLCPPYRPSLTFDRNNYSAFFEGSVIMNVVPFPGVLVAVIVPLCLSTILRQTGSPIPVP